MTLERRSQDRPDTWDLPDPNRRTVSVPSGPRCHERHPSLTFAEPTGQVTTGAVGSVRRSPDSLEAVEVGADHVAASGLTEAEHGCMSRRHAIGMLVNEELPISLVERVIQQCR